MGLTRREHALGMPALRPFALATCFVGAVGAAGATGSGPAAPADGPWRILVLNGTDPTLPAFVAIDRAMRAVLAAPGAHPAELYAETLDMARFPGPEVEPDLVALLRRKYATRPIDAVVAVAPPGLDFAQRYHDVLWPSARIVYHSVPYESLVGRTLRPQTTGLMSRLDVAGTAALALRLLPAARRLVVVAGASSFDHDMAVSARAQLEPMARRIAVDYWLGLRMDELVDRVAHLPPDAVVLSLTISRDADGRTFVPRDAMARLAQASSVPVFSVYETYLGHGIAAGMVDDYGERGRQAAELVQAALASPGATVPPRSEMPSICVADARQLRRFDIPVSALPRNCDVKFAELTAWERYRWQIVAALVLMMSQSLLIAALVWQRRRRLRAEGDKHVARTELAHAARLASMGELTASIAHEIKQPLSAILAHADTAELLLESGAPPRSELQRILAEIRRDNLRANDVITRLRDLLGRHVMARRPLDLNEAIGDALRVVDPEARRRGVEIVTDLDGGLLPVSGDSVHLQQVVLNLVLNAMDAVQAVENGPRRVTVSTRELAQGAQVTVADSGIGIDPSVAARLFESFITTKPHGLGLGLSIAHSIVEAHGGTIEVVAGVERGAVFRIVLPTTGGEADVVPSGAWSAGVAAP
jgi:signal transduction histidine kinase